MLPQEGEIQQLRGFIIHLTLVVQREDPVGPAVIIVVHGQGVAGVAVGRQPLLDPVGRGGLARARGPGQQHQGLALFGLGSDDGPGLFDLVLVALLAPADELPGIPGGVVDLVDVDVFHD